MLVIVTLRLVLVTVCAVGRSRAAFVTYEGLQRYRDFSLRLEPASTDANPRVGLWAKAFMSDEHYSYVGTVTTLELFNAVCRSSRPGMMRTSTSRQKVSREKAVLDKFRQVMSGAYKEQFSGERLADAIAMCKRDWAHFASSCSALPATGERQWLPDELAAEMRRRGLRGQRCPVERGPVEASAFDPEVQPQPLQQRAHMLARSFHLARGGDIQVVSSAGLGPRSAEEFVASPVAVGCCVATRPAPKSRLAQAAPTLSKQRFWVWRVLRVLDPGAALPANSRHIAFADVATFECHLYCPVGSTMQPVWDVQHEAVFLQTLAEKEKHRLKRRHKRQGVGVALCFSVLTACLHTWRPGWLPPTPVSQLRCQAPWARAPHPRALGRVPAVRQHHWRRFLTDPCWAGAAAGAHLHRRGVVGRGGRRSGKCRSRNVSGVCGGCNKTENQGAGCPRCRLGP